MDVLGDLAIPLELGPTVCYTRMMPQPSGKEIVKNYTD